jgi:hypothetical protein
MSPPAKVLQEGLKENITRKLSKGYEGKPISETDKKLVN